jgi:alkaline phosphatase D
MTSTQPTRRLLLAGALGSAGSLALGGAARAQGQRAPGLVIGSRLSIPSGVQTGDVTAREATIWSRSDGPGRMMVRLSGPRGYRRTVAGPWATPDTDHTARVDLRGLPSGGEFRYTVEFEDADGHRGERATGSFSTAPAGRDAQSFVWTGDTAGQGWGINPDLGGMQGYAAMAATRPDFFLHSGDTIYADGPISAQVTEPDGQVWRNLVTPEVAVVAQSLEEYRGRHRYNLMDDNVRAMYAAVPVVAQWDDHETVNNWYPGEILDDPRYTERRVDVLAARGRQAWSEYQPIAARQLGEWSARRQRGPVRIYRTINRGKHLDVFSLDMRTFKSPNTSGRESELTPILGAEQRNWLVKELRRSNATWKVIAADLPLGIIVPDGPVAQESVSNADPGAPLGRELEIAWVLQQIKRHRIRNVVWLTADVHYCAAHHYDPSRAAFTDFDPFWEFVAGPINAGSFGPNKMDATFGPRVDFAKAGTRANQSPRDGKSQFFGHVDVADDGRFMVSLRDTTGEVVYRRTLEPQGRH